MDVHFRTFILEGLSNGSMAELVKLLPKTHANTETFKIMKNETIRFSKRLYSDFNVDLKRIKLRTPIKKLVLTPDVYMREKVPLETYRTIDQLNKIRRVNTIEEIVASDLIPGKEALVEFERNYGDALTKEDISGGVRKKKKIIKGKQSRKSGDLDPDKSSGVRFASAKTTALSMSNLKESFAKQESGSKTSTFKNYGIPQD